MRTPPNDESQWLILDSTTSTQTVAAELLAANSATEVVLARDQTTGRGRFGRSWFSKQNDSLAVSFIFNSYADHPRPYLIGMNLAVAVAGILHARLRWPNDIVIGTKKVGGILTELHPRPDGKLVPIVGLGINLNQTEFPDELADIATSLLIARGKRQDPVTTAKGVLARLKDLPEPDRWKSIAPVWGIFDATPGKRFKLMTGETAIAVGIGSDGELLCSVEGESRSVLAAEAIIGQD
jgi:BirA family transcriptional regulator, biotin operon repressor / biotin---[acetyl-CoA-carboxylase] ligase